MADIKQIKVGSTTYDVHAIMSDRLARRFTKSSEASTAVGYYRIATITHVNWSYCAFTMLVNNSYSGTLFNTIFDVRCADNATTLNSFAFHIIGGDDISSKLTYLETKDSSNNITKIEIFMRCSRYEHPSFYLISQTGSSNTTLSINTVDGGDTPDKADSTTMTGNATNTIVASNALKLNSQSADYYLNYNNFTNTPTIPAAQVQSNWTQTSTTAVDYIKNKPTSYTPASHTHGNITNAGELSTASKIVVTDANKKITTGSKAEADLLTGLTSTTTSSTGAIAYIDSITSTPATGSTTSILEYISASTATVMTGLVSSPTASAATGDIIYVESVTGEGATVSSTTSALTGFTVGSGGFTPTNKYMRVSYSAGTAVRGGTTSRIKFDAGTTPVSTSSFSGTKTNDLVTGVTWSTNTTKVLYGTVTSGNNRNTLEIKAYDLVVSKGDYTPAGTISHTRGTAPALASTTTGGFAYISALNAVSSVGGSVNLQIGASATTTATNWSNVGTTGTVFIESATHSHVAPTYSASNKATVVTGVSGGGASATRKVLRKSGETATAITQIVTQPLTVVTSVSGGSASAGTTKYIKGVK